MRDNDRPFTMPDSYYDPPEENLCPVCAREEGIDFDESEFNRLCPTHLREAKEDADSERCDDID